MTRVATGDHRFEIGIIEGVERGVDETVENLFGHAVFTDECDELGTSSVAVDSTTAIVATARGADESEAGDDSTHLDHRSELGCHDITFPSLRSGRVDPGNRRADGSARRDAKRRYPRLLETF